MKAIEAEPSELLQIFPLQMPDTKPWPQSEHGFAQMVFHRVGDDAVFVEWHGAADWPVMLSGHFLREITPEGESYENSLKAFLPWPVTLVAQHPTYPDTFIFKRSNMETT
jgi:hypothetical protein